MQVAESMLGRPMRCIACQGRFEAQPPRTEKSSLWAPGAKLIPPLQEAPQPPVAESVRHGPLRPSVPLCPGCERPVGWEAVQCPHCGHLFDTDEGAVPYRRDAEPHRAEVIDALGSVALVFGALSLCLSVLGIAVALGAGISALVMAHHDLRQMKKGLTDPGGNARTRLGQNKAITGLLLALAASVFWILFVFDRLGF
ncbi:MAG: hypothetical protein U0840_02300 [Gemmataceae bacterium]